MTTAAAPAPTDGAYTPTRRLLTLEQASRIYPFSVPALRNLVFRAEDRTNSRGEPIPGNGLGRHKAVVRIARRVYIDGAAFEKWISEQVER